MDGRLNRERITKRESAIADLVAAAREIKRVNDAQREYTAKLQALAAEARRTGKSQTHKLKGLSLIVHDYGNGVAMLLEALAKFERICF